MLPQSFVYSRAMNSFKMQDERNKRFVLTGYEQFVRASLVLRVVLSRPATPPLRPPLALSRASSDCATKWYLVDSLVWASQAPSRPIMEVESKQKDWRTRALGEADLCKGESGPDLESGYGFGLRIRTLDPDDFQKYNGDFLVQGHIYGKIFMKIQSVFQRYQPNWGKCPVSQCWRILKNSWMRIRT